MFVSEKERKLFSPKNFPVFNLAVPAAKCYYIRVRYEKARR